MSSNVSIPRNLPAWPVDWDLHIINVCDLELEDAVEFLDGASNYDFVVGPDDNLETLKEKAGVSGVELRLLFGVTDQRYGAAVRYDVDGRVKFMTYYLIKQMISLDEVEQTMAVHVGAQLEQATHTMLLVKPVGRGRASDPRNAVQKIEKIIYEDYLKRGGNNGSSNDEPVEPPDSSPSFSKSPTNPQLVPV